MSTNEQQWFDFEPSAPVATEVEPAPLPVAAPPAEGGFSLETGEEVEVRRSPKATRYRLSVGRDGAAAGTRFLRPLSASRPLACLSLPMVMQNVQ